MIEIDQYFKSIDLNHTHVHTSIYILKNIIFYLIIILCANDLILVWNKLSFFKTKINLLKHLTRRILERSSIIWVGRWLKITNIILFTSIRESISNILKNNIILKIAKLKDVIKKVIERYGSIN